EELGWMLCDGRKLEGIAYDELRKVLGQDSLPDYRGCFPRCIDAGIDGKTTSQRDKDGIRKAGHEQLASTAMPLKRFQVTGSGEHQHLLDFPIITPDPKGKEVVGAVRSPRGNDDSKFGNTSMRDVHKGNKGEHTHGLDGGDAETRPVNIAVYYIVR